MSPSRLAVLLVLAQLVACPATGPSGGASAASSSTPKSAAPPAVDDGGARFTGTSASALTALGATYLCDQRIHAGGGGPHLSVWEWTSTEAPEAIADRIAVHAAFAERDASTFRWKDAAGAITVVVSVTTPGAEPASCGTPAPGTNARVIVSRR